MKFDTNINMSFMTDRCKACNTLRSPYRSSRFFAFRTKYQRHVLHEQYVSFPVWLRIPNLKYLFCSLSISIN